MPSLWRLFSSSSVSFSGTNHYWWNSPNNILKELFINLHDCPFNQSVQIVNIARSPPNSKKTSLAVHAPSIVLSIHSSLRFTLLSLWNLHLATYLYRQNLVRTDIEGSFEGKRQPRGKDSVKRIMQFQKSTRKEGRRVLWLRILALESRQTWI